MDRVDRGLSLSHGIGRRGLYHFKFVPSLWIHAIETGATFWAAHLVVLYADRAYPLAIASWASRACIQCDDNAAHDLGVCGLRVRGWVLHNSADPGDLVCISTPHRAPGAAADWDNALVLQHLVARIR